MVLKKGITLSLNAINPTERMEQERQSSWVQVAHSCNPSYSGGRDQQDHGWKPAWANSSWDLISKRPFTKKGWWSGARCRPWVQTSVLQKKKDRNCISNHHSQVFTKCLQYSSSLQLWCTFPALWAMISLTQHASRLRGGQYRKRGIFSFNTAS
jgi:hypothetical protein